MLAVILLMVYLLSEILKVTSVLFTVNLFSLYPLFGVIVMVAEEPSTTENDLVAFVTVVPSYETEPPLPDWMERV